MILTVTSKFLSLAFIAMGGLCLARAAYIPVKGVAAHLLMERAWDESQKRGVSVLPWPWMDARPIARLSAPRLGQTDIVLDVSTGQALSFAPSHMQQTVKPGQLGLSVIAAHKNTHFAFLEHLVPGDIITVENIDGQTTQFTVTHMKIVDKDTSGINIDSPKTTAQIALVTCYPFSALSYGGPLRYVVHAQAA